MWLVRSWLIGLTAAISLLAQGASEAEPVKIRVSWIAPLSNWASLLMEKKEIARHMGRTYILEPARYAGTPQQIAALANNELEIANLAFSTLPIAIHNAGLSDLRVIADEFQDGVQDYYSQEYMVLSDGPVKRLEDMKGRVIATNAGGSAVDVAMRKMLLTVGLEQKRDYVMIERHCRRCVPCSPRKKPIWFPLLCHSRSIQSCAALPSLFSTTAMLWV